MALWEVYQKYLNYIIKSIAWIDLQGLIYFPAVF